MIEQIVRDYKTHTYESKDSIIEKINDFRRISKEGIYLLNESELSTLKSEFIKFFNVTLAFWAPTYPTKLFRITNNKLLYGGRKVKLQKITDLTGPPQGLSDIGRCNLKGESVFYASLNPNAAFWETQPQPGDTITISEWKIKEGQQLNTHSIFHPELSLVNEESNRAFQKYIELKKEIRADMSDCFHEILKFFTEEFIKPVDSGTKVNYLFSAIMASRFLQASPDTNGFRIDAISYPSVKRGLGITNLAILNSVVFEKLELVNITVCDITETNYDPDNMEREDLVMVSPIQLTINNFDFEKNRIVYDAEEELRLTMEMVDKYGLKR